MLAADPITERWHDAICELVDHTAKCQRCSEVFAAGRHPGNRCHVGRLLHEAEQAAYRAACGRAAA